MQTYSHAILGGGLYFWLAARGRRPRWTLWLGSFLPDVPLLLLTLWYFWSNGVFSGADVPLFGRSYDVYYFEHPVWIAAHNVFHSPPPILLGLYVGRRWDRPLLFWFAVGCGLHSAIDIATHYHDGPLLLWPFDWRTRFESPISYWDRRHYAAIVAPVEHGLDLAVLVGLGARAWILRRGRLGAATLKA